MQPSTETAAQVSHVAFDDGWLLAVIGKVRVTCFTKVLDDPNFAKYCGTLAHQLDELPIDRVWGVLHEVVGRGDMNAKRRKALGEVLSRRREKLARINAGFVMVTSSSVMRGILTAVFWFAPPPYPWLIAPTAREGLRWLATKTPGGFEVERTLAAYEELKRRAMRASTAS
jgi:hypothetical protein